MEPMLASLNHSDSAENIITLLIMFEPSYADISDINVGINYMLMMLEPM